MWPSPRGRAQLLDHRAPATVSTAARGLERRPGRAGLGGSADRVVQHVAQQRAATGIAELARAAGCLARAACRVRSHRQPYRRERLTAVGVGSCARGLEQLDRADTVVRIARVAGQHQRQLDARRLVIAHAREPEQLAPARTIDRERLALVHDRGHVDADVVVTRVARALPDRDDRPDELLLLVRIRRALERELRGDHDAPAGRGVGPLGQTGRERLLVPAIAQSRGPRLVLREVRRAGVVQRRSEVARIRLASLASRLEVPGRLPRTARGGRGVGTRRSRGASTTARGNERDGEDDGVDDGGAHVDPDGRAPCRSRTVNTTIGRSRLRPRSSVRTGMRMVTLAVLVGCSSSGGGDGTGPDASAGDGDARRDAAVDAPTSLPRHVLLRFDDLAAGVDIVAQYPDVTFGSQAGCANETSANYDFGQSPPNYVTTYFSCGTGDTAPIDIKFASAVRGIKLRGIGVNASGKAATFKLIHADQRITMVDLVGVGAALTPLPIDLSAHQDVVELHVIDITDAFGVGYDDLEFDI